MCAPSSDGLPFQAPSTKRELAERSEPVEYDDGYDFDPTMEITLEDLEGGDED